MRTFGPGMIFPEKRACWNCERAGCEDCQPSRCEDCGAVAYWDGEEFWGRCLKCAETAVERLEDAIREHHSNYGRGRGHPHIWDVKLWDVLGLDPHGGRGSWDKPKTAAPEQERRP